MPQELEKLIEETLFDTFYSYLIYDHRFGRYVGHINDIYPIRSHQIIAKCAIDFLIHVERMQIAANAGTI